MTNWLRNSFLLHTGMFVTTGKDKAQRTKDNGQPLQSCIFCRIVERRVPAQIVYEDEWAVAIEDIHPQAPVHLLVIPRKHVPALNDAAVEDEPLLGHLLLVAAQLARERQLEKRGYRTVVNNGAWAGQSVAHLHVHVLGGRVFHWPPG
jgi:histidine triad (HIT) family protein